MLVSSKSAVQSELLITTVKVNDTCYGSGASKEGVGGGGYYIIVIKADLYSAVFNCSRLNVLYRTKYFKTN